jgi:phage protein D
MSNAYPCPAWRITLAGEDLTGRIQPRLMELTLTDNRGMDADELEFSLEDSDGRLDIPRRGAKIRLFLGWQDSGLIDKGTYVVDEIEHSGAPDKLTIRARSADLRESMGGKKERSWDEKTVGAIVGEIAGEHGLIPVVSPDLAPLIIEHIDQTAESDASFLTRLSGQFDAIATVKSGHLLFYKTGLGASVSGLPLETVTITRADGDSHRFSFADRETAGTVIACAYDTDTREKREVAVSDKSGDEDAVTGTTTRVKRLRHTYPTQEDARRAAESVQDQLQRGAATMSLSLAYGRPELIPDLPVKLKGWKPVIDGVDWLLTKVTHRLSNSGLTTDVEMEVRLSGEAREIKEGAA